MKIGLPLAKQVDEIAANYSTKIPPQQRKVKKNLYTREEDWKF